MRFKEILTPELARKIEEVKVVWGRVQGTPRGGSTKLRFRCTSGPRKSRQVSNPADCFKHQDLAKKQRMKTTRARTKVQQARRAQRTKSINTASVLARKLNNPGRGGQPKPYY